MYKHITVRGEKYEDYVQNLWEDFSVEVQKIWEGFNEEEIYRLLDVENGVKATEEAMDNIAQNLAICREEKYKKIEAWQQVTKDIIEKMQWIQKQMVGLHKIIDIMPQVTKKIKTINMITEINDVTNGIIKILKAEINKKIGTFII